MQLPLFGETTRCSFHKSRVASISNKRHLGLNDTAADTSIHSVTVACALNIRIGTGKRASHQRCPRVFPARFDALLPGSKGPRSRVTAPVFARLGENSATKAWSAVFLLCQSPVTVRCTSSCDEMPQKPGPQFFFFVKRIHLALSRSLSLCRSGASSREERSSTSKVLLCCVIGVQRWSIGRCCSPRAELELSSLSRNCSLRRTSQKRCRSPNQQVR